MTKKAFNVDRLNAFFCSHYFYILFKEYSEICVSVGRCPISDFL